MKGLAVGDLLAPTKKMVEIFAVEGLRERMSGVVETEFKNKDRGDIRRTWRAVEEHGPEGEPPPEDLERLVRDVDILAVHICPVAAGIIEKAPRLRIIASARGGVENIDVRAATRKGVAVINTPNHNAQAVAEYAIGLMLAETRNIARSYHALKSGAWREYYANTEFIPELNGSTVGILGYGQTGRLVAKKLVSFDVEILVHDPFISKEAIEADGFKAVDFETLLRESDIVSVHVRLTPQTQGMFGEKQLRMMKPTSYIVNTARAGLFDLRILKRALEEKWIYGAAVDVYEKEPVSPDYPLLSLDNVTFTNHRAGDTRNAYWKAPLLMGKQVLKLLSGEKPDFIVNPEVLKVWAKPE
jgi:D-3-phosphoglycerate dehydrogenase